MRTTMSLAFLTTFLLISQNAKAGDINYLCSPTHLNNKTDAENTCQDYCANHNFTSNKKSSCTSYYSKACFTHCVCECEEEDIQKK